MQLERISLILYKLYTFFLGYVEDLKNLLFSMQLKDMKKVFQEYRKKVPEPLAAQFENRLGREDAIKRQAGRRKVHTKLFPEGILQIVTFLQTVFSIVFV